jgi:glycosyl transferase family 87
MSSARTGAGWWELWRPPVVGAAAVVLLAVGAAVLAGQWRIWRTTVDDTSAQDFGIFYASVRSFLDGGSLYAPIPPPPRFPSRSGQLNLNLPHTNLFFLPLGLLSRSAALSVWVGLSLMAFGWSTWRSVQALGWSLPPLGWLALVVYLVAWGPAAAFTLTIQLNFLLMLPVTAGWLAARRGASVKTGVWLGLAAAMKPFLLLFAPYAAIRRDNRALIAVMAAGAALATIGLGVFGAHAYREWVDQLTRVTWATHYMNASVFAVAERVIGKMTMSGVSQPAALKAALLGVAIATILALTLAVAPRTRHDEAGIDRAWAVLLLGSLLVSPLGWVYYLWIALWPVAAVIGHAQPWTRRLPRDLLLIPGLAGWLWFRRTALWGQPSVLASATFASMYFWALLALWLWTIGEARLDSRRSQADTVRIYPA